MIIYKCKMCGGDLLVQDGNKIAACEYCGTLQTVPSTDDEKRANLFNRANHFRQNSEFDKAMGIYEHILEEDSNDAETYWSIVLCRYGIEYVEDPASRIRKPTINRTQKLSILRDADYLMTLEHADYTQKELYEKEAREIDRIQKEILLIAQKEIPYDIFISYKEKGVDGKRTRSSVLAQDVYNYLTKEGYRVFLSRISLEDKVGQKYEPYIYSALSSAKVMLVIGTEKEEFMAPWVRNEWSRFLSMMRTDAGKLLIPCFKDLDIDDLPNEFQILQSQDMSKIGFEQDLVHGILKVINDKKEKSESFKQSGDITQSHERLLQNAETYMKLRNFEAAYGVYQDITRLYPEDYQGWWGLIQASTKNFTTNDAEEDKASMYNEWFGYVKELAPENIYKEKWNQYLSVLESISKTQALKEIETVVENIKGYQFKIKNLNTQIAEISEEENKRRQIFQNKEKELESKINVRWVNYEILMKEIKNLKIVGKIGVIIFFPCLLLFLIFMDVDAFSSLVCLAFLGIIGVIVAIILISVFIGCFSSKKNLAEMEKNVIENYEKERDIARERMNQEITKISDRKIPYNNSAKRYMQMISDCNRYLEYGLDEIAKIFLAFDCSKFGVEKEVNLGLINLRNRVLEGSRGEENGGIELTQKDIEPEYLEISCSVCKNVNRVLKNTIKNEGDSFQCITCGSINKVRGTKL